MQIVPNILSLVLADAHVFDYRFEQLLSSLRVYFFLADLFPHQLHQFRVSLFQILFLPFLESSLLSH